MARVKWFDRKFDFSSNSIRFDSIVDRLRKAPELLEEKINAIPTSHLMVKVENSWSIQENVGHLVDLEPLWQGRLKDILNKETFLRGTDLQNKKTDDADHNSKSIAGLLKEFRLLRQQTITEVEKLKEENFTLTALHPRLKTPMRVTDHFLFVAEHDNHHLERIDEIVETLSQ